MSILRWIMPPHRRRAGMRRFIFIVLMVLAGAQMGAQKSRQYQRSRSKSPPVVVTYKSQEECEAATGKKCDFMMCDYVPPGKTFEEVCGGVAKGWQPMPAAPQAQ